MTVRSRILVRGEVILQVALHRTLGNLRTVLQTAHRPGATRSVCFRHVHRFIARVGRNAAHELKTVIHLGGVEGDEEVALRDLLCEVVMHRVVGDVIVGGKGSGVGDARHMAVRSRIPVGSEVILQVAHDSTLGNLRTVLQATHREAVHLDIGVAQRSRDVAHEHETVIHLRGVEGNIEVARGDFLREAVRNIVVQDAVGGQERRGDGGGARDAVTRVGSGILGTARHRTLLDLGTVLKTDDMAIAVVGGNVPSTRGGQLTLVKIHIRGAVAEVGGRLAHEHLAVIDLGGVQHNVQVTLHHTHLAHGRVTLTNVLVIVLDFVGEGVVVHHRVIDILHTREGRMDGQGVASRQTEERVVLHIRHIVAGILHGIFLMLVVQTVIHHRGVQRSHRDGLHVRSNRQRGRIQLNVAVRITMLQFIVNQVGRAAHEADGVVLLHRQGVTRFIHHILVDIAHGRGTNLSQCHTVGSDLIVVRPDMPLTIILPFMILRCDTDNDIRLRRHFQLAVHVGDGVVARDGIASVHVLDDSVGRNIVHLAGTNNRTIHLDTHQLVITNQCAARNRIGRIGMFLTIVCCGTIASSCNGQHTRSHCQGAIRHDQDIVCGNILCTIHHTVGRNMVRFSTHIRDGTGSGKLHLNCADTTQYCGAGLFRFRPIVERNIIGLLRQRIAIIELACAIGRNPDSVFFAFTRSDHLQLTGNQRHTVVGGYTFEEHIVRVHRVGSRTRILDATRGLSRNGVTTEQTRNVAYRGGVYLSVVGERSGVARDGHRSRRNLQRTVDQSHVVVAAHIHTVVGNRVTGHHVVHRVRIQRHHIVDGTFHRRTQRIAVGQHLVEGSAFVVDRIRGSVIGHQVTRNAVGDIVVLPRVGVSLDLHGRLGGRIGHRQLTRGQRDVVVTLVSEVPVVRIHRGGHRAFAHVADAAKDIHVPTRGVRIGGLDTFEGVGVASVLRTIVHEVLGTSRDGQRSLRDGQATVGHLEVHIREELGSPRSQREVAVKIHHGGTDMRTLCRGSRTNDAGIAQQVAADIGHRVTGHRLLFTVVGFRRGVTHDGHHHVVLLRHRQGTVVRRDREAAGHIRAVLRHRDVAQRVGCRTRVRNVAGDIGVQHVRHVVVGEGGVAVSAGHHRLTVDLHGVGNSRMLATVIHPLLARGRHRDGRFRVRTAHRQRTRNRGDGVVGSAAAVEVVNRVDAVGHRALARVGDTAASRTGRGGRNDAVTRHQVGGVVAGLQMLGAVIRVITALGRETCGTLVDGQPAVHRVNHVGGGHILGAVQHLHRGNLVEDTALGVARDTAGRGESHFQLIAIVQRAFAVGGLRHEGVSCIVEMEVVTHVAVLHTIVGPCAVDGTDMDGG